MCHSNPSMNAVWATIVTFAIWVALSAGTVASAQPNGPTDGQSSLARPNVVLILADDLGYGDLGCYGAPGGPTPHIDRLARQGVRLTSFYANGPECSPTRTALFTGRYQQRAGGLECAIGLANVGRYDDAIRLAQARDLGLPVEQATLVPALRRAGYRPLMAGKWHQGYEPKFSPLRHGFESALCILGGGADYFLHCEEPGYHTLMENDRLVKREGYMTDLVTDRAVEHIEQHGGPAPLFLYVAYTAPHTPIQGPGDAQKGFVAPADWNEGDTQTYVTMIRHMDAGVGRIVEALRRRNLQESTLLIFASDNGGTSRARNAPLSGHKGQTYEGGIRVPCIVRWPGQLPAGTSTDLACMTIDLTASLVALAGQEADADAQDYQLDGVDLLKHLREGTAPEARSLFWRARRGDVTWSAVREGAWKFLRHRDGETVREHLFNLEDDIAESRDRKGEQAEEFARLKQRFAAWEEEVQPGR